MMLDKDKISSRKAHFNLVLLLIYLICVNLLAGYIATWLRFPSLWGNSNIFMDYAMPFGLTWASAHWPFLILFIIPLSLLSKWNTKSVQRFRIICICIFLILIYGVIEKIPFALFPAIDSITAFFFSLLIATPNYRENPKLTIGLSIFLLIVLFYGSCFLYSKWQHHTPTIKHSDLMGGLFKLTKIEVDNVYKELTFFTELKKMIDEDNVCDISKKMAETLFDSYPFDKVYKRKAVITFSPEGTNSSSAYTLGELEQYIDNNKSDISCYLEYK